MKTTSLGSYPIRKRLAVWQATHKKLLSDDKQYRRCFHSYLITVVFLACALLPFYLPFFGIRVFGFAVDLSIILSVSAAMVVLALWQLRYMNQSIRHYLQSSHDA
ncbi:MAG TPA: hypothetical protein VG938_00570 [Verrucomicrobiae bacterium]|jgi:hypothetical protein|nr:hypothetical protein [Verrucomicrobiae bacterium]